MPTEPTRTRAGFEAHLDVDGCLHWLALNTVIQDWDQYGLLAHNYYLYADPGQDGRFRWIPWDHSFAFTPTSILGLDLLSPPMDEVGDKWPLIRFLLDDPLYVEQSRGYVAQAVRVEYEPVAVEQRFRAAHALIAPYVVGAEGEVEGHTFLQSPTAFDDALDELIEHAHTRQQDVAAYLGL